MTKVKGGACLVQKTRQMRSVGWHLCHAAFMNQHMYIAPLPRLSCAHRRRNPSCLWSDERIGDNESSCCQQSNARQPSHGERFEVVSSFSNSARGGRQLKRGRCLPVVFGVSCPEMCPLSYRILNTQPSSSRGEHALPQWQRVLLAGENPFAVARLVWPLCVSVCVRKFSSVHLISSV